MLETALALNIHGTQVLEGVVPPVSTNDLWTVTSHKTLLYYDFVPTLRKVPQCGFGELLGRYTGRVHGALSNV